MQHGRKRVLRDEWIAGPRAARLEWLAPAAICLIASPRSQQELRLKPITWRTQNQREQLTRFQIVVVDRRTPSGRRKECPAAPVDLSAKCATRCKQGLSQVLQIEFNPARADLVINNGALWRHPAPLLVQTQLPVAAPDCRS
jgi:hypothetical protein